jgi:hypothetical protein
MRSKLEAHIYTLRSEWEKCTPYDGQILGCTAHQIGQIKSLYSSLPEAYTIFLKQMGVQAAGLEKVWGAEFRYPYMLNHLNGYTKPLLDYIGASSPVVFATDNDNLLLYFENNTGESDPVIYTVEATNDPKVHHMPTKVGKLTDLIFEWIQSCG